LLDALAAGDLVVDPPPSDAAVGPCNIDLHLQFPVWRFDADPLAPFDAHDAHALEALAQRVTEVPRDADGSVTLQAGVLYLIQTRERIAFARGLAGRVEGRSKYARAGLIVQGAPTIHPGFDGTVTLEVFILGSASVRVFDGVSAIAQLLVERVETAEGDARDAGYSGAFRGQSRQDGSPA
jgi:dCTP deaminase